MLALKYGFARMGRGRVAVDSQQYPFATIPKGDLTFKPYLAREILFHIHKARDARLHRVEFGDEVTLPVAVSLFHPHRFNGVHAKMGEPMGFPRSGQRQIGRVKLDVGNMHFEGLFAGKTDSSTEGSAIHRLADWLECDPDSPVVKYTRKDEDIDALFDVRAVFQQTFEQLDYENLPSLLRPRTGRLGLQDYEKVFCVDHKGAGDIFDMRGINRDKGCMVVVRPDQYTANVLPLDSRGELAEFFAGIFNQPGW